MESKRVHKFERFFLQNKSKWRYSKDTRLIDEKNINWQNND